MLTLMKYLYFSSFDSPISAADMYFLLIWFRRVTFRCLMSRMLTLALISLCKFSSRSYFFTAQPPRPAEWRGLLMSCRCWLHVFKQLPWQQIWMYWLLYSDIARRASQAEKRIFAISTLLSNELLRVFRAIWCSEWGHITLGAAPAQPLEPLNTLTEEFTHIKHRAISSRLLSKFIDATKRAQSFLATISFSCSLKMNNYFY